MKIHNSEEELGLEEAKSYLDIWEAELANTRMKAKRDLKMVEYWRERVWGLTVEKSRGGSAPDGPV